MTAYTTIPDTDIDPDKPIKSSTAYALRDNLLAVVEGDPTAPSVDPAVLLIGGKGGDGILNDAATLTGIGYFEFSSMARTTALAAPVASVIRIAGDSTLTNTITVATRAITAVNRAAEDGQLQWMGAIFGNQNNGGKYGGGSIGADGTYVFGGGASGNAGKSLGSVYRPFVPRVPFVGANGSNGTTDLTGTAGGGSIIIIVEGDLDLSSGGTINANAGTGIAGYGGGGGGSIIVICTGQITNGTFNALGTVQTAGYGGSPGGSGLILLVATQFNGTQTMNVGAVSLEGLTAGAGYALKTTLTRDQIRTLLQRF